MFRPLFQEALFYLRCAKCELLVLISKYKRGVDVRDLLYEESSELRGQAAEGDVEEDDCELSEVTRGVEGGDVPVEEFGSVSLGDLLAAGLDRFEGGGAFCEVV